MVGWAPVLNTLPLGILFTPYSMPMNCALSLSPSYGWRNLFKSWALNHILANNRENALYHTSRVTQWHSDSTGHTVSAHRVFTPTNASAMHHSHCCIKEIINMLFKIILQPWSTGVYAWKIETQKHQLRARYWTLFNTSFLNISHLPLLPLSSSAASRGPLPFDSWSLELCSIQALSLSAWTSS